MAYEEYKKLLTEFLSYKSISTDPQFKEDIMSMANWLENLLNGYGFEARIIEGEKTNPYVYGYYEVDKDAETILLYGHYDVQPAEKAEGWNSDPFVLQERSGKLFGRGVVDNKGQALIHLFTIGKLIRENRLKYNIKVLIEGNEETGNPELGEIIKANKELFECDYVLISDGEQTAHRPSLDVGFRGGANLTIKYKTADNNVHSGIYGGAIPSSAFEMVNLLAKFYNADNKVTIDGFYEGVDEVSEAELKNNQSIGYDMNELEKNTGIKALKLEDGLDFHTQVGLRPMLTVSGLQSGYTGEGYSNIVPSTATAKVNFRFVTSQVPEEILENFQKFVAKNTPNYVEYSIEIDNYWKGIKLNIDNPKVQEVVKLLEETYNDKVVYKYVGGSIPVIVDFKDILGVDTISVSMGNEDCHMHGADENFDVDLIKKGLAFSEKFLGK